MALSDSHQWQTDRDSHSISIHFYDRTSAGLNDSSLRMGSEVVVSNLKLLKLESSFDMLKLYMSHLLWNILCSLLPWFFIKGLNPHNFERALKSMTCVQIGSAHIDGFKNLKKSSKWYSVAMVTKQNPQTGAKNVFTPAKISQVREMVQN